MSLRSFQDRRCSRVGEGNRRRGAADYVGFGVGIVGSGDGGARDRAVLVMRGYGNSGDVGGAGGSLQSRVSHSRN